MRTFALATLTATTLVIAGCATTGNHTGTHSTPLENTEWQLTQLNGKAITGESIPTLTLSSDENRAYGYNGCNRYFGEYRINGNKLELGRVASTMMACMDSMALEREFMDALNSASIYKLNGKTLELYQGDTLQLRFQPK